eukprot:328240-Pyramimonas_sp.AAC.1
MAKCQGSQVNGVKAPTTPHCTPLLHSYCSAAVLCCDCCSRKGTCQCARSKSRDRPAAGAGAGSNELTLSNIECLVKKRWRMRGRSPGIPSSKRWLSSVQP